MCQDSLLFTLSVNGERDALVRGASHPNYVAVTCCFMNASSHKCSAHVFCVNYLYITDITNVLHELILIADTTDG